MKLTCTALALLLAGSSWAKPPPKPEPPPAPAAPTGPTALTPEQRAAAFSVVDAAQDPSVKADALLAILDDPSKASARAEAWARLGVILDQAGLDAAALHAWAEAVKADPSSMTPLIGTALDLAEKIGDEGEIGAALANATTGMAVDGPTRSRIAEVGGRWHLQHDNLGPAGSMLALGDPAAPNWPEVRALQAIVAARQGRPNDAVTGLQEAIQIGQQAGRDERWLRTQQLNLGRAFYAAENYGMAIYFFAEIPRDSDWWAEAQFERAWAHFRSEDMNGALGLLMTLESPYFDGWYWPEADLLRAYSFFMMCKFPEARIRVDGFGEKYKPLLADLSAAAPAMDDTAYFADLAAVREGKPTKLPAAIVRTYTHDDRFADALRFVAEADQETSSAALPSSRAATEAKRWIEARKQARIGEEAGRLRAKVDVARGELGEMLQGIQITGVDITTLEADLYERASVTGVLDVPDNTERLRKLRRDKEGYQVWPFEGEYWADELGWYQVDARPDCPEKIAVGDQKR